MNSTAEGRIDPKIKDILKLIAAGIVISAAVLMPGVAMIGTEIIKEHQKYKERQEDKALSKYNTWRLKQLLKRLEKQKDIKVEDGIVKITENGRNKLLKYDLEEMKLTEKPDGRWRIVIYDVAELNKRERKLFQNMLKTLNFLQLQKSVYITPFPCENEIEYLRQRFKIGNDVKIITATGLENAQAYKLYFGIS